MALADLPVSRRGGWRQPPRRGTVGELRHDPFAMLPFSGYNVGDYFAYWLSLGHTHDPAKLPRLFCVNWFRKDVSGRFVWPGFSENIRVRDGQVRGAGPGRHAGVRRVRRSRRCPGRRRCTW